jgi:hypothetical protein
VALATGPTDEEEEEEEEEEFETVRTDPPSTYYFTLSKNLWFLNPNSPSSR